MATIIDRLDVLQTANASIVPWGCPIPFFGDLRSAQLATVGINPSNREFTDVRGRLLAERDRRLPTLFSLGITRWSQVDALHLREIFEACLSYFRRNPYDRWFRVLERILRPSGRTYYGTRPSACHLDLVPFATTDKWGSVDPTERQKLLALSGDAVGSFVRDSSLEVLILNGRSVIDHFQLLIGSALEELPMAAWNLPRGSGLAVRGSAYSGEIDELGGMRLGRTIRVLGYNHNLQSSFGVTSDVIMNIAEWLRSSQGAEGI